MNFIGKFKISLAQKGFSSRLQTKIFIYDRSMRSSGCAFMCENERENDPKNKHCLIDFLGFKSFTFATWDERYFPELFSSVSFSAFL